MSNLWHMHQLPHSKHTVQLIFHLLLPSEEWKHAEIETDWIHWFRNFGVRESMEPFKSIKALNIYSKAQRNQWESGHRIQQPLEHTHAGRESSPAQSAVGNCELTSASFEGGFPLPTATLEPWGSSGAVPTLPWELPHQALHSTDPARQLLGQFLISFARALARADGQCAASSAGKALYAGWTTAPECDYMEEPENPIHLTGEPFLPVSFWLANCNLIQLWCLFAHLVSISTQC